MQRPDGRTKGAMRPVKITTDYTMYAEGSVLVEMGNTKVICTASVEKRYRRSSRAKGLGWVTAEYAMLPRVRPIPAKTRYQVAQAGRSLERDPASDRPCAACGR